MSGVALALRLVRGELALARHYRDADAASACLDRMRNLACVLIASGV